jgi:hypothetical protein
MYVRAAAFFAALVSSFFPIHWDRVSDKALSIIFCCLSFTKKTSGFAKAVACFPSPVPLAASDERPEASAVRRSICFAVCGRSFARLPASIRILSRFSNASFFSRTSEPPRRLSVASRISACLSSMSHTTASAVLQPSFYKACQR